MPEEVFPHTIHDLEGGYCPIPIPKEQKIKLEYHVDADRPQGLAIYGPDHTKFKEWYSTANLPNFEEIDGSSTKDETYYIAGFAFYPAPLPTGTWIQSKNYFHSPEFDDYLNDGDYNDLVVKIIPQNSSHSSDECPPRRPGEEPPDCPQE